MIRFLTRRSASEREADKMNQIEQIKKKIDEADAVILVIRRHMIMRIR